MGESLEKRANVEGTEEKDKKTDNGSELPCVKNYGEYTQITNHRGNMLMHNGQIISFTVKPTRKKAYTGPDCNLGYNRQVSVGKMMVKLKKLYLPFASQYKTRQQ
jgi:hypothetical protein